MQSKTRALCPKFVYQFEDLSETGSPVSSGAVVTLLHNEH
jgi:hypothetical protein